MDRERQRMRKDIYKKGKRRRGGEKREKREIRKSGRGWRRRKIKEKE